MELNIPIKIHNRFDIEVKDIITGEIVQRGYAENIVLNNLFNGQNIFQTNTTASVYTGNAISYGRGTGELLPSRTTLFNRIGSKLSTDVEFVVNAPPLASRSTKKIVIGPLEHVGETITEVGISKDADTTIFTHALIKDSEGNPLALGPKTDTQEITIFRIVYCQPVFENGVELEAVDTTNYILRAGTLHNNMYRANMNAQITVNKGGYGSVGQSAKMTSMVNGVIDLGEKVIETSQHNGKINFIGHRIYQGTCFDFNLRTLAENNSTIWSGHAFDKTPVGIGNGSQTTFNLTWDEVWDSKPKAVYVDGVEVTSGVTWTSGSIVFATAPADAAVITADYWVKYMPKDVNHIAKIRIIYNFSEGAPI